MTFTYQQQQYLITDNLNAGYVISDGRYIERTPHVFSMFRAMMKERTALQKSSIFSNLNLDITDDALAVWEEMQATQDDASSRGQ